MNCDVSKYFNIKEFGLLISEITRQSLKRYPDIKDAYLALLNTLKNNKSFYFEYKEGVDKNQLQNSLNKILEVVLTASLNFISKRRDRDGSKHEYDNFKTLIHLGLISATGIKDIDTIEYSESVIGLKKDEELINEDVRRKENLSDILDKFYGTTIGASQFRENQFNLSLLTHFIIDKQHKKLINTNDDLNLQIKNLKEEYLSNISKFLQKELHINTPDVLYDSTGAILPNYIETLNKFYNYINLLSPEVLHDKVNEGWKKTILKEESLFYLALNSYVNLTYFDTLVKESLGDAISINLDLFGFEVDINYNKYLFSSGSEHKIQSWNYTDARSAFDDIAKFSKLIVNLIPMISNKTKQSLNRNINIIQFSNATTKLFSNINKLTSNHNKLKEYVNKFHENPSLYIPKILEYIFRNNSTKQSILNIGLSEFDLNVLYSIYDYVYSNTPDSVKNIEFIAINNGINLQNYSILDVIGGIIDRVMDVSYLHTIYKNGEVKTELKKKSQNKIDFYSKILNINYDNISKENSERKTLLNKYPIDRVNLADTSKYTLRIGTSSFVFNLNSAYGILGHKITKVDGPSLYNEIFDVNSNIIDLSNFSTIKKLLSNDSTLTESLKFFKDVITFIDSYLNTKFLTLDGLTLLSIYKNIQGNLNYIELILISAMKAAIISDLYLKYDPEKNDSFSNYLAKAYSPLKDVTDPNYVEIHYGITDLKTVTNADEWIDNLIDAKFILTGEISKAVTKDLLGNSIANYRTSYLGNNIQYELSKARDAGSNSASNHLFFTKNNNFIRNVVVNTDVETSNNVRKHIKNLKAGDLFYDSIINKFYGTFISDDKNLGGTYSIQPTTYSDKTTFILYIINAKLKIQAIGKSYHDKSLSLLNTSEILDLYIDTIGQSYKNLLNNVISDFNKIFNRDNLTVSEINKLLGDLTENELINLANNVNIQIQLDTHYRLNKSTGKLKFNELLNYYATELYLNKEFLAKRMKLEELNFLNDLLDSNIFFYTKNYKGEDSEIMNIITSGKIMSLVELNKYEKTWIKNNKLILAKVDGKDIIYGSKISEGTFIKLNPLLEKFLYTESFISNNLRYSLTGSEIAHPDKSSINFEKEINDAKITQNEYPELFTEEGKINKVIINNLVAFLDYINSLDSTKLDKLFKFYNSVIRKTEASAQGTQLKRNVIIPATLQYIEQGVLNGIPSKLKVAVIRDLKVPVYNFRGDKEKIDVHDGSAFINPFISILENKGLLDLEVGVDKKPIWHSYNNDLMSATLLKFATFTMTNERMMSALNSDFNLYNLFKLMTNQRWSEGDKWTNSKGVAIDLINGKGVGSEKKISFTNDILGKNRLYYNLNEKHYEILNLGRDDFGYYTEETLVDNVGDQMNGIKFKVYHFFDNDGTHFKYNELDVVNRDLNLHSIDSLFELHKSLGGIFSESLSENGVLKYSESSNYAVVNYMNTVSIRTSDNLSDLSLNTYYQPLKEMMISYAANNTAVKNGTSNINPASAWNGNHKLTYMILNSDGLGIQMDADHDIEESEMTEFSQVISALEANGRLHNISNLVYQDLGKLATKSSELEINAVTNYLTNFLKNVSVDQIKTELYDIIAKTIINNFKKDSEKTNLASEIIKNIAKNFNVNENHISDIFKMPFSDPNIYNSILSTFVATINNKSIKRKYPGSGCVIAPSYNIIQYYKIGERNYLFNDLITRANEVNKLFKFFEPYSNLDNALYNKNLVKKYLLYLLNLEEEVELDTFIPTDIVNVMFYDETGELREVPIDLSDIDTYYLIKEGKPEIIAKYIFENNLLDIYGNTVNSISGITKLEIDGKPVYTSLNVVFKYRKNVTKPLNLKPAKISWSYKDSEGNLKHLNIFDLQPIKDSFLFGITDRDAIQKVFDDLNRGKFTLNGEEEDALDIKNEPAELIMSNLYATKFGTKNYSLADVLDKKLNFFKKHFNNISLINSSYYDIAFTKSNNRHTYITLLDISNDVTNGLDPINLGWTYTKRVNDDVYVTTKDNRLLFKVGKYINGNYIEFISNYKISNLNKNGKINSFILYKINKKVIEEYLNPDETNSFINDSINDIYNSDLYSGIQLNKKLPAESALSLLKILPNIKGNDNLKELLNNTVIILNDSLHSNKNIIQINLKIYKEILKIYQDQLLNDIYSSFEKSLYFTAARIPAQTLQSFMLMKVVGFTLSSKNLAYVSCWLTWLQGSDFDIDKAYIMGFEFDLNGRYIGWSDLFDYSSPETLRVSEYLPTPNNVKYIKTENGLDVTEYFEQIINATNLVNKIKAYAKVLIYLTNQNRTGDKNVKLSWNDKINNLIALNILEQLNTHEATKLSPLIIESAYKNSISSKIQNIVQDLRNMDAAYSPIEMKDFRKSSDSSPKGNLTSNMTLMNPLTKYIMQVQNMVGRDVIGITAVGEKVFFNNSYYWNEGIRSNDSEWHKNMQFSLTFDRILGRSSGKPVSVTKTTIANANFENFEEIRFKFIHLAKIDSELKIKYNITELDILNKTENYLNYKKELFSIVKNIQKTNDSADLIISQLLSAATDNAKELILSKINAGSNLARMYLHLIIMGFSVNDIVSFMISPAVSLVNDLSESNIFDAYISQIKVEDAVKILKGKIPISNFFSGNTIILGYNMSNYALALNVIKNSFKDIEFKSLLDFILLYIMQRVSGNNLPIILELVKDLRGLGYTVQNGIIALSDYVENLIIKIKEGINSIKIESNLSGDALYAEKMTQFYQDLDEFDKVWELATETSTLGASFYGLNQGLPTSKSNLISKLKTLEKAVSSREKLFNLNFLKLNFDIVVDKLLKNNPLLTKEYIITVLNKAKDANIINNFNIENWLLDYNLNMPDGSIISYRKLTSDYYNIIKGTWNIFDMIEKIPQYKAIFNLLKVTYISDKVISKKSLILNLIIDEVTKKLNFLDEYSINKLIDYVDELLIINYLNTLKEYKFPVLKGNIYFNKYADRIKSPYDVLLNLNSGNNIASFKYFMELVLIPNLKKGFFEDSEYNIDNNSIITTTKLIGKNEFISNLIITIDLDIPFYKLDIDMMNPNATPNDSIKFQKYLDGLIALKNYTLNGKPLTDWFMLYNLIVNKNKYGSERLTTIFKSFINLIKEDSIISNYYKIVGDLDYYYIENIEDLQDLGFDLEDALIKIAPIVYPSGEKFALAKYIKHKDFASGEIIYKVKNKNSYSNFSPLPKKVLSGDNDTKNKNLRVRDFNEYYTIKTFNRDLSVEALTNLSSNNLEEILNTLIYYTSRGLIKIYKSNC